MAYDLKLAERVRKALKGKRDIAEKEMLGGIAFLRKGKMFVGVVRDELMVRVGKENHAAALKKSGARTMDFTGRPMLGYVFVKQAGLKASAALKFWTDMALGFISTLKK
jgi:TfoX/Sxy family transcriptional regulator of competence genes